jgi:hypothetical protein
MPYVHGLWNHPLYVHWNGMKLRCKDSYHKKNYQDRGIGIDDPRWMKIVNFIHDMYDSFEEGLTLERIDNNKGYSKENCKWATHEDQNRNKANNVLTMEKAEEIRSLYKTGKYTNYDLAKIFSCSHQHISDIINYKRWKSFIYTGKDLFK